MRRIFVDLPDEAFDAIADLAHRERRDVRGQTALLMERALADVVGLTRPWQNGERYDRSTRHGQLAVQGA